MLRRGFTQILSRYQTVAVRSLVVSPVALEGTEEASKVGKEEFMRKWSERVTSNLKNPNFASDWTHPTDLSAKQETEAPTEIPSKLKLNFYMPSSIILEDNEAEPFPNGAVSGDFGVMPGHVPTVAELRPGVVSVHTELDKEIKKYFVSGGFAFVHADSTADVCVVEAVEVEHLDKDAIKAGLAEYTAKLGAMQTKGDDYEIAAAQVGVDVYSAMDAAVS